MILSQQPWTLWVSQVRAIMRLELKKTLFSRRGLWIYFLALAPVLMFAGRSFYMIKTGADAYARNSDIGNETHMFAGVFQLFFLRLCVFFGCVGIFMNLFRGEVLEKSLHYYFLAPVRREVLAIGKFLSGLLAASLIYGSSVVMQFFGLYWHLDSASRQAYYFHGHGLEHLAAYIGVTLLACVGYGSLFLAAGVIFRNPLIPTVLVLTLEAISGFLPQTLQHLSVIFYLKSLCPVAVPAEIFMGKGNPLALLAVNPTPASTLTATLGLLILSFVVLAYSSERVRRMEIDYGVE